MRIGIDARMLGYRLGGIAHYTAQLIAALAEIDAENDFVIFGSRKGRVNLSLPANFQRSYLWTPPHHRLEQWSLPLELAWHRLDLPHSPDFIPPFRRRCPAVITIHDLAFLLYPETVTEDSRRYYGQVKRAVDSTEGIIAVSEATRQDLARLLGVVPERVDVIHHAPDPRFRPLDEGKAVAAFCQERGLPQPFLLWVGTLEPRKNLATLLQALALLKGKGGLTPKLVAVGGEGWLYQDTLSLVDGLGLRDDVVFFGPASLEELLLLYNAARLFVFPSLYEGFGFPPLEAMACGTPVLSSSASSLPEVLGEAALYLEPLDVEGWAEGIRRLIEDETLRAELRERGLQQAASYSWQRTAEATLAVYRKAAGLGVG